MKNKNINKEYFMKNDYSKKNLKNKRNKSLINKSKNILFDNSKKNDIINEKKYYKEELSKLINNNSISTNNQDFIITSNRDLDTDSFLDNDDKIKQEIYIKNLEKKIKEQNIQLSKLLEYKVLCEKKIKELNPSEILPLTIDSLNQNFNIKKEINNSKKFKKILNTSYSHQHIKLDSNDNIYINENIKGDKTIDYGNNLNNKNYYKDKYNNLYLKYLKLFKDYKNLNKNNYNYNSNIEINILKNHIYKLQNEYDNTLDNLNKEKEINEELNIKINELQKRLSEKKEDVNARQWREQAEIFRKDLVLSQALVNSLKSEIEQINKKNKCNNNIKDRDNYLLSNNNIRNNSKYNLPSDNIDNYKKLNYSDSSLIDENKLLKQSLYDKNRLLSNVLQENNRLNDILKSTRVSTFYNKDDYNKENLNKSNNNNNNFYPNKTYEQMKNNLSQYENKLIYFNDYISNIKKQIFAIHQDILLFIKNINIENIDNNNNKKPNENDIILSDKFNIGIKNIKDKIKDINIDFYSLDYLNDIKCMEIYMELNKIINDEINNILLNYKNYNIIKKKEINSIIDLFELCREIIQEKPLKNTLTDIFNIIQSINRLYKEKYLNKNNKNTNEEINDLDKILISQERELELIKKSLYDIVNSKKTYYNSNNNNNNKNNENNNMDNNLNKMNTFRINNFNTLENVNDNNNLNDLNNENDINIKNKDNYKTNYNFYKRNSNSRDKIMNRPYL